MKILMLTDSMDVGGAETHIYTLALALRDRGHSVTVCSSGGALCRELLRAGISHMTLPLSTPASLPYCYAALSLSISRGGFDIIHSHARLPSLLASLLSRRYSVRHVATAHARFSLTPLRRRLSRWGDRTVAVSQDLKQYLIESYGLSPENITVIPNGIDTRRFSPAVRPVSGNTLRIGTLSRLDRDCSSAALLLCSIAPRLVSSPGVAEIVIGGGGDMLPTVKNLALEVNRRLGFKCVRVVGRVDDTPSFMRQCDVFVGVSRAAIEAALCGVPVIICGNEGYLGRLTEESFPRAASSNFCARGCCRMTPDALFGDLCETLEQRDPTRLNKIRELITDRLDSRVTAAATERIYQETAGIKRSSHPQVLLCGYYGFGNMGDDALLRSAIERARREFPALSVGALTRGGRRDSTRFGISCFKRSSLIALLRKIRCCEHFVLGGGTLLQEDTSLRSLIYYCSLIRLAKHCGARVYLWGNGIGRPRTRLGQALIRRALERCDCVGLRDRASLALAGRLVPSAPTHFEEDMALSIPPSDKDRCDHLLSLLWGAEIPRFIIIAPKCGTGLDALEAALSEAKDSGLALCFVVMHLREDRDPVKALQARYGGKVLDGICYADLCALTQRSLGVYSMRLHALLAAASAGVPYRAFGNDSKLRTAEETAET